MSILLKKQGYVFGNGIAEPGDAKNHTETLLDAYNLGKSLWGIATTMTIRYAVPDDVPELSAVEAECFPPAEAATAAEFAERVAHYADDGYTGTNFVEVR